MKMEKKFDCVEMKREIQEKILKEFEGVPADEARRRQREQIETDPILGPFLEKVSAAHSSREGQD